MRILSREDVGKALTMPEAIDLMATAFREISKGQVVVPQRMSVEVPECDGRALFMPVYSPSAGELGLKVVSLFRQNAARGLPYIHAVMLLVDGQDGRPLALMDGELLTALRTGAASGLATKLLARPDATTAGVFGAGAQARLQLEAVCAVRSIRRVLVFDVDRQRAESMVSDVQRRCVGEVVLAQSPRQAAAADIVCTATTARAPVFADADIRPGTHINAIGAYRPEMAEIPMETLARATVVVDSRASAMAEAGDILQAIQGGKLTPQAIHAELGEIVEGSKTGRSEVGQITVFKSVGNAAQDIVAAQRVLENAVSMHLGIEVAL